VAVIPGHSVVTGGLPEKVARAMLSGLGYGQSGQA
jgi:hypothetical protein